LALWGVKDALLDTNKSFINTEIEKGKYSLVQAFSATMFYILASIFYNKSPIYFQLFLFVSLVAPIFFAIIDLMEMIKDSKSKSTEYAAIDSLKDEKEVNEKDEKEENENQVEEIKETE